MISAMTFVMREKERRYGGPAGIIVRRKRKKVGCSKSVVPSTKPSLFDHDARQNARNGPTTKESTKILWDDKLCRPIFVDQTDVAKVSSDDDNIASDASVLGEDQSIDAVGNHDAAKGKTYWDHATERVRSRSYGTKRLNESKEEPHKAKRSKTEPAQIRRVHEQNRKGILSSLYSPSPRLFSLASPPTVDNSICGAAHKRISVRKSKSCRRNLALSIESETLVKRNESVEKRQKQRTRNKLFVGMAGNSNKIVATSKPNEHHASELEFVDTPASSQPGSHTSVESAKQFFRLLDSRQRLSLEAAKSPETQRSACVRTKRRMPVLSRKVLEEYKEYAVATKASGVLPIPIKDYIMNRSSFFRPQDLFDGFLDS